ncbi:hypothetical protein [Pseudomonas fulva]|uniref:hypothetical protein n=1 Tax=Pseudomonas fulva TaxID=47880 RepID=UPI003D074CE6
MSMAIKSYTPHQKISKQTILYITNNFSQVELAILSATGSKFDYLIYNNSPQRDYNLATDYTLPSNIKITSDAKSAIMLVGIFSAAITTVGHISPVLNSDIVSVLKACAVMNMPIIEVPHGLFQIGFNLSDDSKFVNTASHTLGAGFPVPSFADHQVSWFDDAGVGYPRYREVSLKKTDAPVVPDYTVITTNTNWYLYNFEDQRTIAQCLFELARANPEKLYIWAAHPAELNKQNLIHYMLDAKPSNLLRYGHDREIYFHSIDTTEELIKHAKAGISTVSTCLLEYEMYNIPMAIYRNQSLDSVTNSLEHAVFFSSPDELKKAEFQVPVTGKLHRFSVEGFDLVLSQILAGPQHRNPIRNVLAIL